MEKLLIYGIGEQYKKLKTIINWENVSLDAFINSKVTEDCYEEGIKVITPKEASKKEFDYILCATDIYEGEMRKELEKYGIPPEKIISGKLDYNNFLENSFLFSTSNILLFQNQNIEKEMSILVERNQFCDIRHGIDWLDENMSIIGDGDWAVGYSYLSVLCKILQIKMPSNILEMGLGQSSKVLMSYQKYSGCDYRIIEQDEEWYRFFKKDTGSLLDHAQVFIKPVKQVYNEKYGTNVNCYSDIGDVIEKSNTFDLISIDGPWGSDGISRIDILPYIPQCLKKSWCILVDDYERIGEKNMIVELEEILQKSSTVYCKKIYGKYRQLCLFASSDNKFFCSMF